MDKLVFVYGTLREGFRLHSRLKMLNAEFITRSTTLLPEFDLFSVDSEAGSFPAMINGKHRIWGEVYKCSPDLVKLLDYIEGAPLVYDRRLTRVEGVDTPVEYYHWQMNNYPMDFSEETGIKLDPDGVKYWWLRY